LNLGIENETIAGKEVGMDEFRMMRCG